MTAVTTSLADQLHGSASARADLMRVFEHVPIGVLLVARDNGILGANPAVARLLGYSQEELRGLTIAAISHPEDLGPTLALRQQVLAGRQDSFEVDKRYLRKDGQVVWARITASRIGPPEHGFTIATLDDITARKLAESEIVQMAQQMETERNFYLAAFRYLPNGVLIALPTGEIVYHNQQVERIWGITVPRRLEDFEGLVQAFHPDGRPIARDEWPLARALEHGEYVSHELMKSVLPDGKVVHMHSTAAPVLGPQGGVVAAVAVLSDITPLKEAEELREQLVRELKTTQEQLQVHRDFLEEVLQERTRELAERQTRLRELTADMAEVEHRERVRIAGSIHDEVAQTLASIKMGLAGLQADASPEQIRERLPTLISMVEDAILQSRAIMAELSPTVLQQQGVVEALRWWAARVSERHHLPVTIAHEGVLERLEPEVEIIIFQAAKEIIHNSVKHAQASQITVAVRCADDQFSIEITDNGRGFDPAAVQSSEHGGFGLHHIRERMSYLGGALRVESALGAGTTATLSLPMSCQAQGAATPPG